VRECESHLCGTFLDAGSLRRQKSLSWEIDFIL
jgi:hypothetical protein